MSITKISPDVVDFDAGITITVDDTSAALTIKSTDAGAGSSPILDFVRDSASPADSDALGFIRFKADNDAGEETLLANIKATVVDVSDGSEDGRLLLQTMIDGTTRNRIEITNTEVVVNQSGVDSDFRVESNGDANCFFIDGGNDRVILGSNTARTTFFNQALGASLQIEGTASNNRYVGLGITANSNDANGGYAVLASTRGTSVDSHTVVQASDFLGSLSFMGADGSELVSGADIQALVTGTPGANDMPTSRKFRTTADGASSPSEHMRIHHTGIIGVGTNSPDSYSTKLVVYNNTSGGFNSYFLNDHTSGYGLGIRSDSGNQVFFYIGGAHQGTISSTGGTTAYGTSSDYRLKENVVDLANGITRLKELKPKQFNFIADETNTVKDGFLAHEAQEVVPEAVAGEKDAEINDKGIGYQQMDYGKITPLLTAALQEAIAKIETLEAKVKALEEA